MTLRTRLQRLQRVQRGPESPASSLPPPIHLHPLAKRLISPDINDFFELSLGQ